MGHHSDWTRATKEVHANSNITRYDHDFNKPAEPSCNLTHNRPPRGKLSVNLSPARLLAVAVTPAPPPPTPSLVQSTVKGKRAAALSAIAEDEYDDIDEQDGNGDNNMSMVLSIGTRLQRVMRVASARRLTTTVGTKTLGITTIITMHVGTASRPRRTRRWRNGRDEDDVPAPDEDDQFDVGGGYDDEPQQEDEEEEEPGPEEGPRSKRARLAQEKKEKEKEKAKQKREPLRQKNPNAQPKKIKRNFEPQSDDDNDTGLRRGKRQRYAPLPASTSW
ncbi:hypothetical protein FRC05_007731 [Tulasnella sp. 425]|nr:hypothetical protein FRC05_007731 [Tulasnella sp. 425]